MDPQLRRHLSRQGALAALVPFAALAGGTVIAKGIARSKKEPESTTSFSSFFTSLTKQNDGDPTRQRQRFISQKIWGVSTLATVVYAYRSTPKSVLHAETRHPQSSLGVQALRLSTKLVVKCLGVWLGAAFVTTWTALEWTRTKEHALRWPLGQRLQKATGLPLPLHIPQLESRIESRLNQQFGQPIRVDTDSPEYVRELEIITQSELRNEERFRSWPRFDTIAEGLGFHMQMLLLTGGTFLATWGTAVIFAGPVLIPIGYVFARRGLIRVRQTTTTMMTIP